MTLVHFCDVREYRLQDIFNIYLWPVHTYFFGLKVFLCQEQLVQRQQRAMFDSYENVTHPKFCSTFVCSLRL